VASGSIAGVYRATLPDGRSVALKLQRPDIRHHMTLDLSVIHSMSALAEHLPPFRGVPASQLTGFVCAAILGQLDFELEQENLDRIARNFAGMEYIWIPETLPELCRTECLAMEFIPDLVARPIADIDPVRRPVLAARTLSAVYQMLFMDGFVHCDLHPGNVYYRGSKVVILDAGFSVRLPATVRRQFSDFFLGLALGRGRRCGEVVMESAMHVAPDADVEGFIAAISDLVMRYTGVPAKDFQLMRFGTELFRLQRDFGLYAASEFVFPLLSLLVIEGTIRGLHPEIDFQAVARPMLLRAAAATAHLEPARR
jgi:ubiquinone biosynthesis protein